MNEVPLKQWLMEQSIRLGRPFSTVQQAYYRRRKIGPKVKTELLNPTVRRVNKRVVWVVPKP